MSIEERWHGFFDDPNAKFKILALVLAIAVLQNALYLQNEIEQYKKAYDFNRCYANAFSFNNTTSIMDTASINISGILG